MYSPITRKAGASAPWLLFMGLLLLITSCGTYVRLYATHYSYSHVDEEIARAVVSKVLDTGSMDTNWARTDVDAQFRYDEYNFSSYYLFAAGVEYVSGHSAEDLAHPYALIRLHLRRISAVLGGLCILAAGLLGFRMGGSFAGIIAALLTACSPNLIQDSLYARPESFVTLLSLLFCLALTYRKHVALAIASLCLGLLIACKFTFLIYIPFPLLLIPALKGHVGDEQTENQRLTQWGGYLLTFGIPLAAGFYLGAPYAVKAPWEYLNGVSGLMHQYLSNSRALDFTQFLNDAGPRLGYYVYTVGYPSLLFALIGIYALVRGRKAAFMLALAGPVVTLLYFIQTALFMERNASQAVPILFVLAGLGCAEILRWLQRWRWVRFAGAALLTLLAVAAPLSVTATVIHPALDGGYQHEVDDEVARLSQGGEYPVIYIGREIGAGNAQLCGSYFLMTRSNPGSREYQTLLNMGYTEAGRVVSPLERGSSLGTLLAPTTAFLAAPAPTRPDCRLILAPLDMHGSWAPLPARVVTSGGWTRGGARADAPGWSSPLYGSWSGSDANSGDITIGPFKACGSFMVPFTAGPARTRVGLRITAAGPKGNEVIYDGVPPANPGAWSQLEILNPPQSCGTFTVAGTDDGKGWGQWLGVGMPVTASKRKPRR